MLVVAILNHRRLGSDLVCSYRFWKSYSSSSAQAPALPGARLPQLAAVIPFSPSHHFLFNFKTPNAAVRDKPSSAHCEPAQECQVSGQPTFQPCWWEQAEQGRQGRAFPCTESCWAQSQHQNLPSSGNGRRWYKYSRKADRCHSLYWKRAAQFELWPSAAANRACLAQELCSSGSQWKTLGFKKGEVGYGGKLFLTYEYITLKQMFHFGVKIWILL